jgi:ketosteroid isomerase-like protein
VERKSSRPVIESSCGSGSQDAALPAEPRCEMQEAYVYTLRDGKILRVEEYFDRREGLAAAGLSR